MNIEHITLETSDTFSTLFEKVVEVHKKLFPDATLQSQCDKFNEEFEEFKQAEAEEDICAEFADMFIVAAGISRFSPGLGEFIAKSMIDVPDKVQFANAIVDKMNKNIDRKWDNKNGFYKHTTIN